MFSRLTKKRIGVGIICLFLSLFISCAMSTSDLAAEAQEMFIDECKKEKISVTVVEELTLVKKSKTEYTGVMTVKLDGEVEQITVDVLYDGKEMLASWE